MLDGLIQIGARKGPAELVDTTAWDQVRPRFATVYLENKCHLACEHCYESESTHPKHARLSLADYERVFDELASLGVLYLSLTGGEIFLRGDLFEIVALGRKKRFAVRLYTSGTLIDEARADRIRELQVSEVQVSLYSADAAVHDHFVGHAGAYAKTVRALGLLKERGVLTVMKTPVLDINIDSLEPLAQIAHSLGADFRVDPLLHPRTSGDQAPLRHQVSPAELREKLLAKPHLFEGGPGRTAQSLCGTEAVRGWDDTLCAAARQVISIGADGGVLPCASFPLAGGNVKEHSVVEIWRRSALFDDLRRTTFGDLGSCQGCAVKASCDPCMAYALIEHGDHRACNAASRNFATALFEHAEAQARPRRACGCGG